MNVVGYIRVSTQGQVKEGYSLSYQQDEIKAYCKEQGWNLITIYTDAGVSGAKVDEEAMEVEREGFRMMLDALSSSGVDYVIVLNTNRLWRSDLVKVLVHREFRKYRVDIRSIEQPTYSIHRKDPNDFLMNGLMELLDQYQRLEIALKLGRGRNKKAQQGGYAGGRVAFGYSAKRGTKVMEINRVEASAIRRLFELRERYSDWTLAELARRLNAEGFTTQQGKRFTKVQVKRILDRKEFYGGIYRYGNVEAVGVHPAILEMENSSISH
ncbi:recombinase family protein [Paenibacillus odorifer]|jgi:site-specific DNA recombinase|uniref:recombinase family protein n=1 Tax=Paenibacillus odorifer TaxID=189426 RepID=UPI00096E887B|nr:recombinase family protein [Paenibacillus odorifer]OMD48827.1 recombinase family protein [Paenibacillus odorifer]